MELQTEERTPSSGEQRLLRSAHRARERIVTANLLLVVHCAVRYRGQGVDLAGLSRDLLRA
ncbi:MAG: hypothetical protein ERJ68_02570 [Aphanocapsa feldmannii 277cI]|uniref:Uncharacterized protein n=1 Tax=Aphanocapsa feldmannii 277cI TaxID=2507554 RepID=A0A524RUQ6_9CHRO|nr:MAG: hypothetical protein ERJ68_02570 [Aphanocapsa feldmannii 277cI]